ncbi:MAG: hypothetical protein ACI81P_001718 [Neolewinella sp.]|jgi:hypothetical protein
MKGASLLVAEVAPLLLQVQYFEVCNPCNASASESPVTIITNMYRRLTIPLTLLLLTILAPACAPKDPPPPSESLQNLVLLTDTTQWEATALHHLQDSLATSGYRVLTSGYSGETATELLARLPWLLQPGVDVLLYDDRLAGAAAFDSLFQQVGELSGYTEVRRWGE